MCRACWQKCIELGDLSLDEINELPDAAFAVLEPDYVNGVTRDKNARHLPHHDMGVKTAWDSGDHLNRDYLKAMLELAESIEPVTSSISKEELVSRATAHLKNHLSDIELQKDSDKPDEKQDNARKSLSMSFSKETIELADSKGLILHSSGSMSADFSGRIVSVDKSKFDIKTIGARFQVDDEGDEAVPINLKDIIPGPNDYLYARYRALSKALIPYRFIDFSKGNVLKRSTKMLRGRTIYPNHLHQVEAWLGTVINTEFDESTEPAGIDAEVKIYAYKNLDITQGLLVDPPAINSVSVNVQFQWEKSHDLDDYEFFSLLGTEVEGEVVRAIVTLIEDYGEISLVWAGADPTAKRKSKIKIGSN